MADNVIRIDTRIDTDSAERDLDNLDKKITTVARDAHGRFVKAGTAIDSASTSTKGLTSSMSALGKVLTGISITTVAYKVAQGVKEIYTTTEEAYASIRKASTMFGDVQVDQEKLVQNLSKIAAETGSDIATLGDAAYQAMSAGIDPTEDMANVLSVVEKSAKLAAGGFTDTETAMSASLSVLNAYKMSVNDFDKVQGILLQTQNKGVTTVGQLGSALSKVTPTAAAFGVEFEQVASAIALMTKQGTNTEVATTALSTVLSELGKSGTTASKNLKAAAESAGLTKTSFTELLNDGMNLSEILTLMSTYAEDNGLSMVDMFGSIEAGRASLQLAGDNMDDFNKILESMGETSGLVQESFEKTVTPADRLSSAFDNLVITVGQKLKPTWDGLLDTMATMLNKMTGQQTAGDLMLTSFESLKIALEEYKTAEEQARIETNALNSSILSIAKTNLNRALFEANSSFMKSRSNVEELNQSLKDYNKAVSDAEKRLESYARGTGHTVQELQEMEEEERNLLLLHNKGEQFIGSWNTQNDIVINGIGKRAEILADLADAEADEANMVEVLAMMYAESQEDAEFFLKAYPELTAQVKERSKYYIEQAKAVQDLTEKEEGTEKPVVSANESVKTFQETLDELLDKYEKLSEATDVLGEGYYSQETYLRDLKSLYAQGLVEGLDASSEAMVQLKEEIKEVEKSMNKAEDATIDWEKELKSFASNSISTFAKTATAAFDEIFQKEQNLINLEEELAELNDDKQSQIDSLATARAEYNTADAKGNEEGRRSAQEKINKIQKSIEATQKLIDATEKEKKSVEDGSSVWKAFGNSAMQSMASVLESLGSSLAAQAAAALIGMNWGGAALATAGSLAAFAAASWARSQKFASGGIVGGTSYSGDNVLARVNSGELILNMAQQDNVAKALSTLADMSGIGTSGGAGVNVYLSGASFYGLDEPAVGKAIYDNIRQLQYEGVI